MNLSTFIQILKALPLLIKVIYEVWEAIKRLSNGRPEQLLVEVHNIHQELNNAKTSDEKKLLAQRISNLWAGMPDKKAD
jgi:hypothetical protein